MSKGGSSRHVSNMTATVLGGSDMERCLHSSIISVSAKGKDSIQPVSLFSKTCCKEVLENTPAVHYLHSSQSALTQSRYHWKHAVKKGPKILCVKISYIKWDKFCFCSCIASFQKELLQC